MTSYSGARRLKYVTHPEDFSSFQSDGKGRNDGGSFSDSSENRLIYGPTSAQTGRGTMLDSVFLDAHENRLEDHGNSIFTENILSKL